MLPIMLQRQETFHWPWVHDHFLFFGLQLADQQIREVGSVPRSPSFASGALLSAAALLVDSCHAATNDWTFSEVICFGNCGAMCTSWWTSEMQLGTATHKVWRWFWNWWEGKNVRSWMRISYLENVYYLLLSVWYEWPKQKQPIIKITSLAGCFCQWSIYATYWFTGGSTGGFPTENVRGWGSPWYTHTVDPGIGEQAYEYRIVLV